MTTSYKLAGLPFAVQVDVSSKIKKHALLPCHPTVSTISRYYYYSPPMLIRANETISRQNPTGSCQQGQAWGQASSAYGSSNLPRRCLLPKRNMHLQRWSLLPCDRAPGLCQTTLACLNEQSCIAGPGVEHPTNSCWRGRTGLRKLRLSEVSCKDGPLASLARANRRRRGGGMAMAAAAAAMGPAYAEEGKDTLQARGEGVLLYKTTAEIDRAVILNTLTCSAAAISEPIMSLVDTVFVGRMGTVALASLGPNAAIFNAIFFMMSLTGAIVVTETIGLAHAQGDLEGVQRSLVAAVVLSIVIGVVVTIAVLSWGPELLVAMGTNEEMMAPALAYLNWRVLAVPASLLLIVAQAAYRAVLDLKTPCMVVLAAGLCNAILDPILMFKLNLGVAGASIATSFSQWAGVAFLAYMMTKNRNFMGPAVDMKSLSSARNRVKFAWPAGSDYIQFLKDCSPLMFRAVIIIATYTLSGIVATKMGTNVAAGHQLLNQIQLFQLTVLWAFLEVGQSMVVNAMGRGGRRAARAIGDRIVWWSFIASLVLTWGTWALRASLPRIFIQDEAVLELVSTAMVPCCGMILIGWNNALEGVLMGAGDMPFVVNVFLPSAGFSILMLLYAMYSKGTLPLGGALPYIWWAMTLYYALLTLLYCFRYWVPSLRGPL